MASAAPTGDIVALPLDVESELRILFRREAQLDRQMADVRNALEQARCRFARSNDLCANPRMELLRTRFAPQPKGSDR